MFCPRRWLMWSPQSTITLIDDWLLQALFLRNSKSSCGIAYGSRKPGLCFFLPSLWLRSDAIFRVTNSLPWNENQEKQRPSTVGTGRLVVEFPVYQFMPLALSAWWVNAIKLIPISSIITLYLASLGGTSVEYWNKDYFLMKLPCHKIISKMIDWISNYMNSSCYHLPERLHPSCMAPTLFLIKENKIAVVSVWLLIFHNSYL